jgi:hypothetical protein
MKVTFRWSGWLRQGPHHIGLVSLEASVGDDRLHSGWVWHQRCISCGFVKEAFAYTIIVDIMEGI